MRHPRQWTHWYPDIVECHMQCFHISIGGVAQMVERSLSMREVRGSMPRTSIMFYLLNIDRVCTPCGLAADAVAKELHMSHECPLKQQCATVLALPL